MSVYKQDFEWRPPFYRGRTTHPHKKLPKRVENAKGESIRELALLRFTQGKTERELAAHFGRSKTTIHEFLARMVKNDFRYANITEEENFTFLWKHN